MVNIFGTSTEKVGERGPPGPAGSGNFLKELVKWLPELAIEQIRKNVKFSTFLVETLPPDDDWDVQLNRDRKRVTAWRSFNHSRDGKMILRATAAKTGGSVLKKLLPPRNAHQRYGIKFEEVEQNMYYTDGKLLFLRNSARTVVLTITFLVGALPPDGGAVASTTAEAVKNTGKEEFILNDYHLEEKTLENLRGISISSNAASEEKKFDLYLHGANNTGDVPASIDDNDARKNRLKIGTALKTSWFYTLQVKWGAQIERPDGSVRQLDSFYAIYENEKCLLEKPFRSPLLSDLQIPAFSLGGIMKTSSGDGGGIADNCFTGILSNVEILQSNYETIPKELLHFIAKKQILINDDWLLQAPALKRKKIN